MASLLGRRAVAVLLWCLLATLLVGAADAAKKGSKKKPKLTPSTITPSEDDETLLNALTCADTQFLSLTCKKTKGTVIRITPDSIAFAGGDACAPPERRLKKREDDDDDDEEESDEDPCALEDEAKSAAVEAVTKKCEGKVSCSGQVKDFVAIPEECKGGNLAIQFTCSKPGKKKPGKAGGAGPGAGSGSGSGSGSSSGSSTGPIAPPADSGRGTSGSDSKCSGIAPDPWATEQARLYIDLMRQQEGKLGFYGWACSTGTKPGRVVLQVVSASDTKGSDLQVLPKCYRNEDIIFNDDAAVWGACGGGPGPIFGMRFMIIVPVTPDLVGRFVSVIALDPDKKRGKNTGFGQDKASEGSDPLKVT
ncbi:hypothetical protein DFJ74DRAFT_654282 [Hyaloraphidium curvatum]|nr:hypothetical protein DFJ74DRAFT_654282 [Hyaloraphidium curvatum]